MTKVKNKKSWQNCDLHVIAKYGKKNQILADIFFSDIFFCRISPSELFKKKTNISKKKISCNIDFVFLLQSNEQGEPKKMPKTAKMSFRIFRFCKNCPFMKFWSIYAGVFNQFSEICETWKNSVVEGFFEKKTRFFLLSIGKHTYFVIFI